LRARRLPLVDEYVEEGEAAVFVDGNVVVLSPLATSLLGMLDGGWSGVERLAAGLVAEFGPAPDDPEAIDATAQALEALARMSVVELAD
jgi:hypothetical protein